MQKSRTVLDKTRNLVHTLYILKEMRKMTTNLQKWENSQGIRIPKSILDEVNWKENERVLIEVEDGKIVLKKVDVERENIKELFNKKTNLTIVCLITNTNNSFPLHIPLDNRVKTIGVILCEHIKALDLNSRKYQVVENLPEEVL